MDNVLSLDEYLQSLPVDMCDGTLLAKLQVQMNNDELAFCAELPARYDVNAMLSVIQRWREIRDITQKAVRVYAWAVSAEVEKAMCNLISRQDNMYLSILPTFTIRRELNV